MKTLIFYLTFLLSIFPNNNSYSLASEMRKMFLIIIEFFSDFAGVDLIEMTRSIYRDEQASNKIKILNPNFYENLEKYEAA